MADEPRPSAKAVSTRRRAIRWTGKIPSSTTRTRSTRNSARLRHLPRLPPLRQPVPRVPDAVRSRRRIVDDGSRRRRQGRLREGRRPVLPVRPVLPDQVPVRSAASVERRFPAPDAAREGRAPPSAARRSSRRRSSPTRRTVGKLASIPVVVDVGQRGQSREAARASCSTRRSACIRMRACRRIDSRTARRRLQESRWRRGAARRRPAARAARSRCSSPATATLAPAVGRGSRRGAAPQRHRGASWSSAKSAAACRSSSSAISTAVAKYKETNIPVLAAAARDGWDITRRDSVLRADVQAGTAADVSRRRGRAAGQAPHLRSVRISVAAASGRPAARPTSRTRSARSPGTRPAISACRTSARRRATCSRWCPDTEVTDDRTLLRPRRHLRREDGDLRDRAQDRQAGREPHPAGRAGSFRQRLPDGRQRTSRTAWATSRRRRVRSACCATHTESESPECEICANGRALLRLHALAQLSRREAMKKLTRSRL